MRVSVIASLCLAVSPALAEPPFRQILVTPRNESRFDFSVVLSGQGKSRSFSVYAPPRTNGDCVPLASGTELRAKDGRLIYSQTVELAFGKTGPEIRGQFEDPTHLLVLWISYLCPRSEGTRYSFSSEEWENAGLLR